ncbi:MAG: laccase domain-containing protein, partial [Alphaproteobacteria bacterium]|nr:laccase domain-containing protein [Alphaproteobacteria bacterium]
GGVVSHNQNLCTYGRPDLFFSYRRSCHNDSPDYGRQISAICIK